MKILFIAILCLFCFGCATTFVPSQCISIEPPPKLDAVWKEMILTDPQTGEEIPYIVIPKSKMGEVTIKKELLDVYANRCWKLNAEK